MRPLVLLARLPARVAARGTAQPAGAGAAGPRRGGRDRSDRLLGVRDHRGLEVADGHAQEGRLRTLPLNAEGRKVGDTWDPARRGGRRAVQGLRRRQHHAAARAAAYHVEDANTLKIETDAGTQTRLLRFGRGAPGRRQPRKAVPVASWAPAPRTGTRWRGPRPGGSLKVVTTNLTPGYVRKNGAPHSAAQS